MEEVKDAQVERCSFNGLTGDWRQYNNLTTNELPATPNSWKLTGSTTMHLESLFNCIRQEAAASSLQSDSNTFLLPWQLHCWTSWERWDPLSAVGALHLVDHPQRYCMSHLTVSVPEQGANTHIHHNTHNSPTAHLTPESWASLDHYVWEQEKVHFGCERSLHTIPYLQQNCAENNNYVGAGVLPQVGISQSHPLRQCLMTFWL